MSSLIFLPINSCTNAAGAQDVSVGEAATSNDLPTYFVIGTAIHGAVEDDILQKTKKIYADKSVQTEATQADNFLRNESCTESFDEEGLEGLTEKEKRWQELRKEFWRENQKAPRISLKKRKHIFQNPETRETQAENLRGNRIFTNFQEIQKLLDTRKKNAERMRKMRAAAKAKKLQKLNEGINANREFEAENSQHTGPQKDRPKESSQERAQEAFAAVLLNPDPIEVKQEPIIEPILPGAELQILGSLRTFHAINNSLRILQDPNDPSKSLLLEAERPIDLKKRKYIFQNPETRETQAENLRGNRIFTNFQEIQKLLDTRKKNAERMRKMRAAAKAKKLQKLNEGINANREFEAENSQHTGPQKDRPKESSQERAQEAFAAVLPNPDPIEVKQEPIIEPILPGAELQILGSLRTFHAINNSLPILQDPNDPSKSLLLEAERPIDQITVFNYGELSLNQDQRKKMTLDVREWLNSNEHDRAGYERRLNEIFETAVPVDFGPTRGVAAFAKKRIHQYEVIAPYAGALLSEEERISESFRRYGSGNTLSYLFGTRSSKRVIDAYNRGNVASLVNTGKLPREPQWAENNISTIIAGKNLVFYVANRDIEPGEELLVDYGPNYNPEEMFKAEPVPFLEVSGEQAYSHNTDVA